jgi:hypothetical protein
MHHTRRRHAPHHPYHASRTTMAWALHPTRRITHGATPRFTPIAYTTPCTHTPTTVTATPHTTPTHPPLTLTKHNPTPIQLNKRLEEMTAALSRAPNTSQNRPTPTRTRSGRYQPYNTGQGMDSNNRPNDENARSVRPISSQKKAKVGSGSHGSHDQNFTSGTDSRGLSACAICLSRNPHDVTQCDANLLWDGHTPAFARKGDKGAKLRAANTGDTLCLDWNLPRSCNSNSHVARHRCSGCGNNDHGAQTCRLAQPKVQN